MRFLVTRPEPGCSSSAARLAALGHEAIKAPLLREEKLVLPQVDLENYAALAVTSARVAGLLAEQFPLAHLRRLTAFAVGDRTANAMREIGLETVFSAGGTAEDLVELIADKVIGGRVFYPAAEIASFDLGKALQERGLACDTFPIYRMEAVSALPEDVLERLRRENFDGILVYSRRCAEALVEVFNAAGLVDELSNQTVVAISQNAAGPLGDYSLPVVADEPNENALFSAALRRL